MPRARNAARISRAADRGPRILEAAMRLFSAMPYADVRVDAVAAAAGVAKPTLYRYFPTKEALFIDGLAWELAALRREIETVRRAPQATPAPERLHQAVAAVLERIARLRPALQAVEGEGGALNAESRRVLRAGFAALKAEIGLILRDGARNGDLAAVDSELAVNLILGGVRMAAGSAGRPVDPAALADLLLDGLRPPARRGAGHASQGHPANEAAGPCRLPLGAVA